LVETSPCALNKGVVHNLLVAKTYLISACTASLLQKDYSIATKWGFMAKKKYYKMKLVLFKMDFG